MKLLIQFAVLISAISCAIAGGNKAAAKCTRQLEGIIHIPDNFYKTYLFKLMDELLDELGQLPATTENEIIPVIKEFAEKYDITIISQPPFGRKTTFTATSITISTDRIFGQIIAPTYINFRGFNFNPSTSVYQVSAQASGPDGTANTIFIEKSVAAST
jgi:hypothetical protein